MSENSILDNIARPADRKPVRTQLLTTLCVLTWIGSVFSIGAQIFSFYNSGWEFEEFDLGTAQALLSFVCNIATFVGAMQMMNMKRTGYYTYVVAEALPILPAAIIMVIYHAYYETIWQWGIWGLDIAIRILFIYLYSLFYKHFT